MESGENFSAYIRVLAKRWWLILLLAIVAASATVVRLQTEPPSYAATTKLRVSAPEPGEVAIYTPLGRGEVRKEVEYVKNDFAEMLEGLDTAWRTAIALQLEVDGDFVKENIKVVHSPESDFISLSAKAPTPQLASRLANTHIEAALAYFGDVRAKPITGVLKFLRAELARTSKDLEAANRDLQDFRNRNKIGSVDDEIASFRSLITAIRIERDTARGKGDAAAAERFDVIIQEHEAKLSSLIALTVEYRSLTGRVAELESAYGHLLSKETEAKLKEQQATDVHFIQIVEPARDPVEPASANLLGFLAMSIVAAILLGSMLSFFIEYLSVSGVDKAQENTANEPEVLGLA